MSGGCIVSAPTIVSERSAELGVQGAREGSQTNLKKNNSVFNQTITVSAAQCDHFRTDSNKLQ